MASGSSGTSERDWLLTGSASTVCRVQAPMAVCCSDSIEVSTRSKDGFVLARFITDIHLADCDSSIPKAWASAHEKEAVWPSSHGASLVEAAVATGKVWQRLWVDRSARSVGLATVVEQRVFCSQRFGEVADFGKSKNSCSKPYPVRPLVGKSAALGASAVFYSLVVGMA